MTNERCDPPMSGTFLTESAEISRAALDRAYALMQADALKPLVDRMAKVLSTPTPKVFRPMTLGEAADFVYSRR